MISYSFFSFYLLIALHACALSSPVAMPPRVPGVPAPLCPVLRSSGWLLLLEVVTGLLWLSSACSVSAGGRPVCPGFCELPHGANSAPEQVFILNLRLGHPIGRAPSLKGSVSWVPYSLCGAQFQLPVWLGLKQMPLWVRSPQPLVVRHPCPRQCRSSSRTYAVAVNFPLLKLKCSPFFAAHLSIREVGEVYLPAASTCLEWERPALSAPACPASWSPVLCWVTSIRVN